MKLRSRRRAAVAGKTGYARTRNRGYGTRAGRYLANAVVFAGGNVKVARCVTRYRVWTEQPRRRRRAAVAQIRGAASISAYLGGEGYSK